MEPESKLEAAADDLRAAGAGLGAVAKLFFSLGCGLTLLGVGLLLVAAFPPLGIIIAAVAVIAVIANRKKQRVQAPPGGPYTPPMSAARKRRIDRYLKQKLGDDY